MQCNHLADQIVVPGTWVDGKCESTNHEDAWVVNAKTKRPGNGRHHRTGFSITPAWDHPVFPMERLAATTVTCRKLGPLSFSQAWGFRNPLAVFIVPPSGRNEVVIW